MKQINNFPRFKQAYDYDCGASAMQSVLAYYGFDVPEGKIIQLAGTKPEKGTPVEGLKKVAKKFGIKSKSGVLDASALKEYINEGKPVIIPLQSGWMCKQAVDWSRQWARGHYVIPIGYDAKRFYFADPRCFVISFLNFKELEQRWHDTDGKRKFDHWGIVFYGKKPKYNPNTAVHIGFDSFNKQISKGTYKKYRKIE